MDDGGFYKREMAADTNANQHDVFLYDVEMTGKLGYSCLVRVCTNSTDNAEKIALRMFPELECSGNTQRVVDVTLA
jgi:hypothetical protein